MSANPFAGTTTLVRFIARRDRIWLPAWIAGMFVFVVYLTVGIPAAYGTDDELATATVLFADPVGRLLTGPGYGFEVPTVEGFIANGYGLYLMLVAALMSILVVVRHTRAEEQSGRAELILAGAVHRRARLVAALWWSLVANLSMGLAVFVPMALVGGHDAGGSMLLAASVASVGLAFAGVATLTAQLATTGRAVGGLAGAVVGVAFALRAVGDMAAAGGSVPSWLSPLGQAQQTAPFVLDRWWPLLPVVLVALATATAGAWLAERRDLGAGLIADRPGPPTAAAWLRSPIALDARLQRPALAAWAASLVIAGLLFGAFADALLGAVDDLPEVFTELFGADDLLAGYLAYMAMFMGFLVAAHAVLAAQGRVGEELSGRLDSILGVGVSRQRWMLAGAAVTTVAVVVLMALTGAATGIGAAIVTGDARHVGELTIAHLAHVPGVLVVAAAATLLHGIAPRWVPAAWALVGYGVVVGTFGPLLGIPGFMFDLSPFAHAPQLPAETFDGGSAIRLGVLLAIASVLAGLGIVGFGRRDLVTG